MLVIDPDTLGEIRSILHIKTVEQSDTQDSKWTTPWPFPKVSTSEAWGRADELCPNNCDRCVPQADASGPARQPLHAAPTSRKSSPGCTVALVST